MSVKIAIVYHSGAGHTAKVAQHVRKGVESFQGAEVAFIEATQIEPHWAKLDEADCIIFGCPTYMGGPSAAYKTFIDAGSQRFFKQAWKGKMAAGFTNSGSYSGDKLGTLTALVVNAAQQGMIWISAGLLPPHLHGAKSADENQINRLGGFLGLMTQSNDDSADIVPPAGDLKTAELFGQHVAEVTAQFVRGRGQKAG